MESNLSEQESLQLITQMVQQAQNNFRKGAGDITIFWGCVIAFIALAHFALAFVIGNQSAIVWSLILPGWIVSSIMQKKKDRSAIVKTHIEQIINFTWIMVGLSCGMLQLAFWSMYYYFNMFQQFTMEAPVVLIISGIALFISGIAYRFRPYVIGGIIFWLGAIVCLAILPQMLYHLLIMAICMIIGYIIPGMKFNKQAKENI